MLCRRRRFPLPNDKEAQLNPNDFLISKQTSFFVNSLSIEVGVWNFSSGIRIHSSESRWEGEFEGILMTFRLAVGNRAGANFISETNSAFPVRSLSF